MTKTITLAQGNGGEENRALISEIFFRYLKNDTLEQAEDAAILELRGKKGEAKEGGSRIAFTTDSFTVSPIFFPGGDIGKLAVCGTCNDLAMMGAQPKHLSLAVMAEEGFAVRDLERIVRSGRIRSDRLRRAFLSALICVGVGVAIWVVWWAGLILAGIGAYHLAEPAIPARLRRVAPLLANGLAVLLVDLLVITFYSPLTMWLAGLVAK
jgi:hypothetical protein